MKIKSVLLTGGLMALGLTGCETTTSNSNANLRKILQEMRELYVSWATCECANAKCTLSVSSQTSIEIDSLFEGIDFYALQHVPDSRN